jgi:outer membrane protein
MGKGRVPAILTVAAVALLLAGGAYAQGLKVAVIDVNRILNESEAGKAAKKKIESRYEELKKKVEDKQEEAKKIKDEIDKQKIILGKEKLKEKEDSLNAKIAELRQLTQEAEKEMQTRQGEATQEVLKNIKAQLDKLVAQEKIDLVLDQAQGGIIHFTPSLDITARVQEMVNKEKPGGK